MTADGLDPLDRLIAERERGRLIIDFVRRLDLGEPGSVCLSYHPEGPLTEEEVVIRARQGHPPIS